MTETTKGTLAVLLACLTWGLAPLYYALLTQVPAFQVLGHRVLWSFVTFFLLVLLRGSYSDFRGLLRPGPHSGKVVTATVVIAINWTLFVWAVMHGHVLQTSLGYFIYPLVSVAFGYWFFGERPQPLQWAAIGLAALAVALLTWHLGALPWVSLTLGISFGFYGVVKKRISSGPIASVTAETTLMLPFALAWLAGIAIWGWGGTPAHPAAVFGPDALVTVLLVASGIITAGPLVLVSYGAQRLKLATLGVLFYINPSLQFLCAVVVLGEHLTTTHTVAFGLTWSALALYSFSELRRPSAPGRPVPGPN